VKPARLRTVAWAALFVSLLAAQGRYLAAVAYPTSGYVGDLGQDWLSARNVLTGHPPYELLNPAYERATGRPPPAGMLLHNAHPPAAVLVALPFAPLDYPAAHLAWTLLSLPLLAAAVGLVVRELGGRCRAETVFAALALALLAFPVRVHVELGNWSGLLAFLVSAAWVADRRGRQPLAGAAVGVAAALKVFPAFLLLYFAAAGRWRAVGWAAAAFLAVNAAAAAACGPGAFATYARDVVPATAAENASSWMNVSATGFWMRLFAPTPDHKVIALADAPVVGAALARASQLAVAGLAVWAARRRESVEARDRGFASACAGMVLASPVSWSYSFLLLPVPVGLLAARLPAGRGRLLLWVALAVIWVPPYTFAEWALGRDQARDMLSDRHDPLTPAQNLVLASPGNYAAAAVFGLTLLLPARRPPGPVEGAAGGP
jgi:hypothetical protein